MASGEEDGAVDEKENNNKKKTKSAIVTAWLTFYNIAMTAGWLVLAMAMARFYIQKASDRYNLFIILYPLGVIGELLTIYAALPVVRRTGMFSMRLPNKYNVSFDYYYCLIIVMLSYIPLFPQLYFHMLRQRRRVLHGEVIVEKDD